jgi:hypothetical protein
VKIIPLFVCDDTTGEITNRLSFEYPQPNPIIRFVASKRCNVVHVSPWFKMDFSVDCCNRLLFLYVPWLHGLETSYQDPLKTWQTLSSPGYARFCINKEIHRQQLSVGLPAERATERAEAEDGDCDAERPDTDDESDLRHGQDMPRNRDSRAFSDVNSVKVVTQMDLADAKRYLADVKFRLLEESSATSRLTEMQIQMMDENPSRVIHYDDHETKLLLLQQMQEELTPDQRHVVDAVIMHILNPSKEQLVGLVSGEGGTGKTQIMKVIKLFVQTVYGKVEGSIGCCAIGAPTGPAAFNVGGDTWQSLFHRGHTKLAKKKTDIKGVKDLRDRFKGLQLLMFDETSMIGALAIWEIHLRCTLACDNDARSELPFGGYHVIFFGDFYQLDPVNDTSLSRDPRDVKAEIHIAISMFRSALNMFFELKENVRARRGFGGVSQFALGLTRIRLGIPIDSDIAYFTSLFRSYDECVSQPQHEKEIFIFA